MPRQTTRHPRADTWAQRRHAFQPPGPVTARERVAWARADLERTCRLLSMHPHDAAYVAAVVARTDELDRAIEAAAREGVTSAGRRRAG